MEAVLELWIADRIEKNVCLDIGMIRTKAKGFYDTSVAAAEPTELRFSLRGVLLHDEAAFADTVVAEHYAQDKLLRIIEKGAIFQNKLLIWTKRVSFGRGCCSARFPSRLKKPRYKAHKNRVRLITCENAASFIIKPGLIYKPKNPRALKNKYKALLLVYWKYNTKAWITKALTDDWFVNYFISQVKLCLACLNPRWSCLLLLHLKVLKWATLQWVNSLQPSGNNCSHLEHLCLKAYMCFPIV